MLIKCTTSNNTSNNAKLHASNIKEITLTTFIYTFLNFCLILLVYADLNEINSIPICLYLRILINIIQAIYKVEYYWYIDTLF